MRRIYLIGLILLMTIVLVIGGGLMYLNGSLGSDQMLALVNRTVLHTAGLELRWREASGSFLFNLTVEEPVLMMADGDTLLRADRMKLGIRPWSIVRGGIELTRVEADRPVIDVLALSADTPEERSARRSARRERRDRQAVEAGADTTAGQEEKPLHIRNVVIRRGTVTFARSGPVRAASGLLFRGDLRIGKEIGIAIDIRRLRGVLDDWGLMIEDLDGGLTIAEDYLRFTDTRVRTRSTRLTMAGDLDLRQERGAGDLAFDLTTRGLQEYWPAFGPLKCFLPGYFCGTRTSSRLNV